MTLVWIIGSSFLHNHLSLLFLASILVIILTKQPALVTMITEHLINVHYFSVPFPGGIAALCMCAYNIRTCVYVPDSQFVFPLCFCRYTLVHAPMFILFILFTISYRH